MHGGPDVRQDFAPLFAHDGESETSIFAASCSLAVKDILGVLAPPGVYTYITPDEQLVAGEMFETPNSK